VIRALGTTFKIEFAAPERIRSRRVISRSRAGHTGMFPSWKLRRMVHWESVHELNAFRLLDCDPNVTRYAEQPCVIRYELDGQIHLHSPDILVEIDSAKELWEIKPDHEAHHPDVIRRSECLGSSLPRHGYTYRVVVGSHLAGRPGLGNANLLLQYGRWPLSDLERELARRTLRATGVVTWESVCSGLLGPRGRVILCRMVLEGTVDFDRSKPLSQRAEFFLRG
jgi:hypothetical protein